MKEEKSWGILCWTPTGAYWVKYVSVEGYPEPVRYADKETAERCIPAFEDQHLGIGWLEAREIE